MYQIQKTGGALHVVTPYNPTFITTAKNALGGRWDGQAWVFDARNEGLVRDAIKKCYGWEPGMPLLSVRIVFNEAVNKSCGPVCRLGRALASAAGRDSGAKLGDGVVLEAGSVTSSGSVKNWYTAIRAGTVLVVHDVPQGAFDNRPCPDSSAETYTIVPPTNEESPMQAQPSTEQSARMKEELSQCFDLFHDLARRYVPQLNDHSLLLAALNNLLNLYGHLQQEPEDSPHPHLSLDHGVSWIAMPDGVELRYNAITHVGNDNEPLDLLIAAGDGGLYVELLAPETDSTLSTGTVPRDQLCALATPDGKEPTS